MLLVQSALELTHEQVPRDLPQGEAALDEALVKSVLDGCMKRRRFSSTP